MLDPELVVYIGTDVEVLLDEADRLAGDKDNVRRPRWVYSRMPERIPTLTDEQNAADLVVPGLPKNHHLKGHNVEHLLKD